MLKISFKNVVGALVFCTLLLGLGVFSISGNNFFTSQLKAQEMSGEEGGEMQIREVKNYDLTIYRYFYNNSEKVDSDDCVKKSCALYSPNGKCTFITIIPK